jgi:hypothetical protein
MKRRGKIISVILIFAILVVLIVIAYFLYFGTSDGKLDEDFPGMGNGTDATVIASGTFQDGNYVVDGTAMVLEMDGKLFLRLEDFKSESGPGLYVYLSVDLDASDFVDLGELKGTEGNMNYDIPAGTDIDTYNNVLIWCEPFNVLFGSATLE